MLIDCKYIMADRVFKGIANTIANLTWLLCIFYLVALAGELSDIDNFEMPLKYQPPLDIKALLKPYWPHEILIAVFIFALYLALCSEWMAKALGKLRVSGNLLIPGLILLYIGGVLAYILTSGIDYPTRIRDPKLFPALLLAWGSIILVPLLLFINKCLKKPCGIILLTLTLVICFGASYVAFGSWIHYLKSGEIDLIQGAQFIR